MSIHLGSKIKYILTSWDMLFHPPKIPLRVFSNSLKILSNHQKLGCSFYQVFQKSALFKLGVWGTVFLHSVRQKNVFWKCDTTVLKCLLYAAATNLFENITLYGPPDQLTASLRQFSEVLIWSFGGILLNGWINLGESHWTSRLTPTSRVGFSE